MQKSPPLVLALYPNARGLGYATLEMTQKLLDSGVITVRPASNDTILARIAKFADFHRPEIIIVRVRDLP